MACTPTPLWPISAVAYSVFIFQLLNSGGAQPHNMKLRTWQSITDVLSQSSANERLSLYTSIIID